MAMAPATSAVTHPIMRPVTNPVRLGITLPANSMVIQPRTMPLTAADTELPTDRKRVFTLFADAPSDGGTELRITVGMAPYARPRPAATLQLTNISPHVDPIKKTEDAKPVAMNKHPVSNVHADHV